MPSFTCAELPADPIRAVSVICGRFCVIPSLALQACRVLYRIRVNRIAPSSATSVLSGM